MSHVLRSSFFRMIVLLVACATFSVAAFAQSTATGAIAGTVMDQQKAVVADARVAVRNLETNAQETANTDSLGKFRIVLLPPGTYEVTAQAANFARTKAERVIVEVGRITELELTMAVAGKSETVEVAAEAPLVNTLQQDFSNNVNVQQINDLPINGRRWSNFALLAPGAAQDGNFGLISFRGISGLMNNSTVDGGDNNQAFFAEERGRTRASYVVSQASVREFQVNTSNYSAEYGRAAGAVVNTVTKGGTNKVHGQAFYYIRDNDLGATNPFTTQMVQQTDSMGNTSFTSVPFKPLDRRQQFGGNLGGPLVKDRLFFFFNYDGQRQNFPGVAMPTKPALMFACPANATCAPGTVYSSAEITTIARGIFGLGSTGTPTAAQTAAAQTAFNNGIAFLAGTTGEEPRTSPQDIFFPKLDLRLSQNNTLSTSYNRMRRNALAGVQSGYPVINRAIGDWGNDLVKVDIVNARLSSVITNSMSNELRFSWGRDFEYETSQPMADIEKPLLAATATPGYGGFLPETYIASTYDFGRPYYLERYAYPDEHRIQVANGTTWAAGKHLVKWGVDFNRTNDLMNSMYRGGGSYSYDTRAQWIIDYTNALNGHPSANYYSFNQGLGPFAWEFNTTDYAVFLQDDFRVHPRLTLNLGLRYEYEQLPGAQAPNPVLPNTIVFPHDKNNVGPRFGFALDIFGDGKTALRGGYGIYYGRIINSTISEGLTKTGLLDSSKNPLGQAQYTFSASTGPLYPNVITKAGTTKQDVVTFAPNLQNPQIHQADLILEHEIAKNTVVSVSYLLSLGRELVNFIDTNIANVTTPVAVSFYNGPFAGRALTIPFYTANRPDSSFSRKTWITSNINSSYNALVLQLNRRMTNGLQLQGSYTWAHALDQGQNSTTFSDGNDVYDPYNFNYEYGNSTLDIRQRLVGSLVWEPQRFKNSGPATKALLNGWSISPILAFNSGRPFTEYVSGRASGVNYTASSFNGSGGTNRLAPLLGRNSFRYPWIQNIDLRLARRFNVREGQQLEVLAEAFNLFNHQNISGMYNTMYAVCGSSTTPSCSSTSILDPVNGTVPRNTYIYDPQFGTPTGAGSNIYRERQIQFAVRYAF